jgi:arylsulfatase A-like enzyme/type 1 glutamine amidotransferase
MFRVSLLLVLAVFAAPVAAQEKAKRPPNVVIVYVDDMGYGDLGCYGSKIPTPNLDRMAREGIRFKQFYVAQAVCSASRAALLTGRYSNRVGILGALGPANTNGLGPKERTLADLLKALGYRTSIYGKWHLGHLAQHLPTRHGFDEYYGLPYSNDMWPKHPTAKFPDLPLIEGEKTIELNPDQTKLTTAYTERAVQFIEKNKDRPFFLYVPHTMPHVPLHVSERHQGKSGQGLYGDVIMELDWSVGRILDALKKAGIDDDTIVLFASDNGPWLSYGHHGGSAGRLREGKGTTWEGGVRVPFLARWPGKIPAGSTCDEPAMTIDILPTIAKITGAKLPELPLDGKDIGPLLRGEAGAKSPHEAYYFYWGNHLQAVRSGPWKLYFPRSYISLAGNPGGKEGQPAKMTTIKSGVELFDLKADESETTNVAERNPEVVRRLETLADRMRADLGDSGKAKKLVLLFQKPDGHPPETHEYEAGQRLLAKLLAKSPGLDVSVVRADDPWREGPDVLAKADGVVLFVTEGARWAQANPERWAAFQDLAKRGGGLSVLHWGMGTKDAKNVDGFVDLFGGCHGGLTRKYKVLKTTAEPANPKHPIAAGLKPFEVRDEFYYKLWEAEDSRPILRAAIDGKNETVAWALERKDGGRSFGFSGLHFHENWGIDEYRRLVVQGVLWTMKQPIPPGGVAVNLAPGDLKIERK